MAGAACSRLSLPPAPHHCMPAGHCPPDAGAARWVRRLLQGMEGMLRGWGAIGGARAGPRRDGAAGEPERSEASAALLAIPALVSTRGASVRVPPLPRRYTRLLAQQNVQNYTWTCPGLIGLACLCARRHSVLQTQTRRVHLFVHATHAFFTATDGGNLLLGLVCSLCLNYRIAIPRFHFGWLQQI